LPHFGQVRRLRRILSITVPIISGARQCGQPMFISRYGSLTSLRGAAIGLLKQKLGIAREWQNFPAARARPGLPSLECSTWKRSGRHPAIEERVARLVFLSRRARAVYAVFGFFGISTTLLPNTSPKSFVTARSAASAT
jgi:hypothetical protein